MKILIILFFIMFSFPVYSQEINQCSKYKNDINFKTDQKTFMFLAFLNVVNNINYHDGININDNDKEYYKSLYEVYKNNIRITEDIYIHHKLDNKKFKDAIFMLDTRFYNDIDIGFEMNLNNINKDEIKRLFYLPSSNIIKDFYSKSNIFNIWKNKYENENLLLIEKYKEKTLQIIEDTSCFLRINLEYPIDIIFQKSNYFNLLGQSYFSRLDNKYIIKVFISDNTKEEDILKTIRHEYVHLVLNEEVNKNSYIIENEINKFYKNIPEVKYLYIEELIAKAIEDIHYYKSKDFIIDMIFYYNKNPIYRHFIDKIPEYLSSNKTFKEFIPDLFKSFSSIKEINRYINIQKKLFKKG